MHRLNFAGAVPPHVYIPFGVKAPASLLMTELGLFVLPMNGTFLQRKAHIQFCVSQKTNNEFYYNLPKQAGKKKTKISLTKRHAEESIYLKNMTFLSLHGASAIPLAQHGDVGLDDL